MFDLTLPGFGNSGGGGARPVQPVPTDADKAGTAANADAVRRRRRGRGFFAAGRSGSKDRAGLGDVTSGRAGPSNGGFDV